MSNDTVDILGREQFIESILKIINIVSKTNKNYTYAIDGNWGSGKSFVVNKIITDIENSDENNDYFIFYYNCWFYNYYDEPLISIISSMLDLINEKSGQDPSLLKGSIKTTIDILYDILGKISKNKLGINVLSPIKDTIQNKNQAERDRVAFDSMFTFKEAISSFQFAIEDISQEYKVIFIIDELDRCMPEYVIKILDRLHHLMNNVKGVSTILAFDSSQLTNSIKKIFGDSIDIDNYLNKYIDFSISLDNGTITDDYIFNYYDDISKRFVNINSQLLNTYLSKIFKNIDIRTQEKIINKTMMIHNLICEENLDYSLLCFEIMIITIKLRIGTSYASDVSWLIKNNYTIEKSDNDYFKNLNKKAHDLSSSLFHTDVLDMNILSYIYYLYKPQKNLDYLAMAYESRGFNQIFSKELIVAKEFLELSMQIK